MKKYRKIGDYRSILSQKNEISHGFFRNIILKFLKYYKVSSRGVLKQLTDDHKQNRVSVSQAHLSQFLKEGNNFYSILLILMRPGFIISNQIRDAIRPGKLTHGLLFHHDNARPHTAKHTMETLRTLGWEVLVHPAYSPDLAPCYFHLYAHPKAALGGQRFSTNLKVEKFSQDWCRKHPQIFFCQGFDKLVKRWNICIEKDGDYVGKYIEYVMSTRQQAIGQKKRAVSHRVRRRDL
ncbi:hypothetical protein LAZ67_5004507 [Cordylochernes scorpioides]|uniref:Transposase n=1 Tax=Cordylochernes scorpioides TaxID=51811 RepID=A0ABY6KJ32_9ARAC|nr:hypothetical protein LAZ67_5004507 [Cordylochernes scorpioides]